MLVYLLANQYTPWGIVDGAKTIVYKVVLHLNSKFVSSEIIKTNEK